MGIINNFPSGNTDLSVVTATADDIRKNKKILGSDGNIITGNLVTRSTNDIVISPGSVHINPGIYSGQSGIDKPIPNWPITGITGSTIRASYKSINKVTYDIELPVGGINAISKLTFLGANSLPSEYPRPYFIGRIEDLKPFVVQCLAGGRLIDIIPIRMDNSQQKFYDTWCWCASTSYSGTNPLGLFLDAEIRDTSLHIELSIPNTNEGFIYNYGGRATITNYGFSTTGESIYMSVCQYT